MTPLAAAAFTTTIGVAAAAAVPVDDEDLVCPGQAVACAGSEPAE